MQALGNDFMVINALSQPISFSAEQIQQMSHRHLGIGFDQLLTLEPARQQDADFYCRIWNADGSEVGQCGNGLRCLARLIALETLSPQSSWILDTLTTRVTCRLTHDDQISVLMGRPHFPTQPSPQSIADALQATELETLTAEDITTIDLGNPHVVIQVSETSRIDLPALGKQLNQSRLFPQGVNVSVMQVHNPHAIYLRVFERGAGETQACGSAACAAIAAGCQKGCLQSPVTVSQAGGTLELHWPSPESPIELIGPATRVYQGTYEAF